jgi:hypothetical protein
MLGSPLEGTSTNLGYPEVAFERLDLVNSRIRGWEKGRGEGAGFSWYRD